MRYASNNVVDPQKKFTDLQTKYRKDEIVEIEEDRKDDGRRARKTPTSKLVSLGLVPVEPVKKTKPSEPTRCPDCGGVFKYLSRHTGTKACDNRQRKPRHVLP